MRRRSPALVLVCLVLVALEMFPPNRTVQSMAMVATIVLIVVVIISRVRGAASRDAVQERKRLDREEW